MDTDALTPTEQLVLDLLAARRALGVEPVPLPGRAVRNLDGLVEQDLIRIDDRDGVKVATLTDQGADAWPEPTPATPSGPHHDTVALLDAARRPVSRRSRLAHRLARLMLRLARPTYRRTLEDAVRYGMNAAARDAERRQPPPDEWDNPFVTGSRR